MNQSTRSRASSAIVMIRPVLILFMMFAHIIALDSWSVMSGGTALNFDDWMAVFLESALAKSGVPLLSLISGYLAVRSLETYGYPQLLWRKAKRLIWPLFWSNLLFILLFTYPTQAVDAGHRPDLSIYPFDAYGWFQAIFVFYKMPANEPLYFLKDLYTCFILLPLLLLAAKIRYFNLLVLAWMAWKCFVQDGVFLVAVFPFWFLRFDIVFAFYVGILLTVNQRKLLIANHRLAVALVALLPVVWAVASAVYVVYPREDYLLLFQGMDFTVKVMSVVSCVALMSLLSGSDGWLARGLTWLSPYSYTLFLTHLFFFTAVHRWFVTTFGWPDFFAWSGTLYVVLGFLAAVSGAVVLRTVWVRWIRRAPARA